MGCMLPSNPQGLLIVTDVQIHLYCELRLPGVDECRLTFDVLSFLNESSCLVDQDTVSCLWFVLTCHLQG